MQTNVSFEQIVESYTPLIKSQIKKLHLTKQFDDYFQVGVIALWHAYSNYDESKGNFSTYAFYSVRGHLLTELRKEKRFTDKHQLHDEQESLLFQRETSHLHDEPAFELLELEQYVQRLTRREKCWVYEAFFFGKKPKEIAATYNVSTNTVQSWRKSALKKLRQWMKEE